MPISEVPKINFWGGEPLFDTSRCQFLKSKHRFFGWGTTFRDLTMPIFEVPKSIFRVGDRYSGPYDANVYILLLLGSTLVYLALLGGAANDKWVRVILNFDPGGRGGRFHFIFYFFLKVRSEIK